MADQSFGRRPSDTPWGHRPPDPRAPRPRLVRAVNGVEPDDTGNVTGFGHDSKVDIFSVTSPSTGTYLLSHVPITDSWNLSVNGITQTDGVDYTVDGRTVTIVAPTDMFVGASVSDPWTLRVQYDHLAGVASTPGSSGGDSGGETDPTWAASMIDFGNGLTTSLSTREAGDLLVAVLSTPGASSVPTMAGYTQQATKLQNGTTRVTVFTREATNTSADDVTIGAVALASWIVLRFTGLDWNTAAPVLASVTDGVNANVHADAPNSLIAVLGKPVIQAWSNPGSNFSNIAYGSTAVCVAWLNAVTPTVGVLVSTGTGAALDPSTATGSPTPDWATAQLIIDGSSA